MAKDYHTVERFVVYGLITFVISLFLAAVIVDDYKEREAECYKLEKLGK